MWLEQKEGKIKVNMAQREQKKIREYGDAKLKECVLELEMEKELEYAALKIDDDRTKPLRSKIRGKQGKKADAEKEGEECV
jgi:hypothetical protein